MAWGLRKELDDITNQSLKWNPQGNCTVDQNPPGRENSKINLKRRSTKLPVKHQQLLLKKKETLCLEINSNDDDYRMLCQSQTNINYYNNLSS